MYYCYRLLILSLVCWLVPSEYGQTESGASDCCLDTFDDFEPEIDDEVGNFSLITDGFYFVPTLTFGCSGNITGWNVAVQLNDNAKTFLNGTNSTVKATLRLGVLQENDLTVKTKAELESFDINTTNVSKVQIIPHSTIEVASGEHLVFVVSSNWNVGVVAVSKLNPPHYIYSQVSDLQNIHVTIVKSLVLHSPMISPVLDVAMSPTLMCHSTTTTPSETPTTLSEAPVIPIAVSVPLAILCCIATVIICLIVSIIFRRVRRKEGRFMMANNMIVCRPISEEEALSTQLQHKAIKALVLGSDEIFASASDNVKEKESSSPYKPPPSEMDLLHDMLMDNHCLEIPRRLISFGDTLGHGHFGTVCEGTLSTHAGNIQVAVKMMRKDASAEEKIALLQEAAIMGQFRHPCIIWLFGIITVGEPMMLILELLENGDLKDYLIKMQLNQGQLDNTVPQMLLTFCQQIAQGMEYLSKKHFIHRDLAARNVLLDKGWNCKISDFGLSRDLSYSDYYTTKGGEIPVRWTAPEALKHGKYNISSDVWSYGMVLFEIWSLGSSPYPKLTSEKVFIRLTSLEEDDELDYIQYPPPGCPRFIYSLMLQCWRLDHHSRPTFEDIVDVLAAEESNESELVVPQVYVQQSQNPEMAAQLGAPLDSATNLYCDLRNNTNQL